MLIRQQNKHTTYSLSGDKTCRLVWVNVPLRLGKRAASFGQTCRFVWTDDIELWEVENPTIEYHITI